MDEEPACHDVAALRRSRAPALQAACRQAVPSQRCLLGVSEGSTLCFLTSSVTLGGARSLDEVMGESLCIDNKKGYSNEYPFLLYEADGARTRDLSRDRAAL